MLDKKIFYFILILFIDIYLFILFDRLSYGLPARFLISLVFSFLLIGPALIGLVGGSGMISGFSAVGNSLFRKMFKFSIIPAVFSGIIFSLIRAHGVSGGEAGLGMILSIPFMIIIFMTVSAFVLFILASLLSDSERLSKSLKVMKVFSVFLFFFVMVFLFNCTSEGCKNSEYLAEEALSRGDPTICDGRNLIIDFRSDLPSFFQIEKDPYPWDDVKSDCLFNYVSERRDSARPCIDIRGPGRATCISNVIEAHPEAAKCEELKNLDSDLDFYEDAYSICYFNLAHYLRDENYCSLVGQSGYYSRNRCYQEIAPKKRMKKFAII